MDTHSPTPVKYSICATCFNNGNRIVQWLETLLFAMLGLNYEIVVVDNCSFDGTFELLNSYTNSLHNLKLVRKKCTRGEGRRIASNLSKGSYIIYVDCDVEYIPDRLRRLIVHYSTSSLCYNKCLLTVGAGIYPRNLLFGVGNMRDLNCAEDTDLWCRLYSRNLLVFLPVAVGENEPITGERERRYAKNIFRLMIRRFWIGVDAAWGNADSVANLFFRYRFLYRFGIAKTLLACFRLIVFKVFNSFLRRRVVKPDTRLMNQHFVMYSNIVNAVNPLEFGFLPDEVWLDEELIDFLALFHQDVRKHFALIKKWHKSHDSQ